MATSRTLGQLGKRILIRADKLGKNVEKGVRSAAIALDNEVVSRTPVDTGRAKGNWIVSIGQPSRKRIAIGGGDAAGQVAMDQGRSVISKWKLGMGSIFVTNNLSYIQPLDNGSSQQAVGGMTSFGIQAARDVLKRMRLLK